MDMDAFNWGVVGLPERARIFSDELELASGPHRLAAWLPEGGDDPSTAPLVPRFSSLHELLQSGVDAVYLSSCEDDHYAQVRLCLLHRVAVLCERPIALSAAQLQELMLLAEKQQTFMMEAMWIRFLPSIKKVLALLSEGALGEVISVKASLHYKNDPQTSMFTGTHCGSALIELGSYPVFLCTLLLGLPIYIQANGKLKADGRDEFFSAFLSYDEGRYGFIEASLLARGTSSATITCERGIIRIKNPWSIKPEGIEVEEEDGTRRIHKSEWKGRGLYYELDEVYQGVQEGRIESQLYCHHFMLDVAHSLEEIREGLQ